MLNITHVTPLPDYRVRIALNKGSPFEVSLAPYLDAPGYAPLRDPELFARVCVEEWGHGIEWPGDIGIPLSALNRLAKEQAGRAYPVQAFNAWMQRNGLSAATAARALGLTRRTIVYYHAGQKPIPQVVGLACEAIEARLKQAA